MHVYKTSILLTSMSVSIQSFQVVKEFSVEWSLFFLHRELGSPDILEGRSLLIFVDPKSLRSQKQQGWLLLIGSQPQGFLGRLFIFETVVFCYFGSLIVWSVPLKKVFPKKVSRYSIPRSSGTLYLITPIKVTIRRLKPVMKFSF